MLDNLEIDRVLKSNAVTRPYYLGCFSCDTLPPIKNYPCTFVLNLDDNDGKGLHWAAVFILTNERMFYFDSFGIGPNDCEIDTLATLLSWDVLCTRNVGMFQKLGSDACGYYTCYVIYQWSAGVDFLRILKQLSKANNPDTYVKMFVKNTIDMG